MQLDFGKTADDYTAHRPPMAAALFDRLAALGIGIAGQRVLDVGGGTGLMAAAMARRGCEVILADLSAALLAAAPVPHRIAARAEALPLPDASFDVVTAAGCWHWFDRSIAPCEISRVLAPRGRVAVTYQTYIPLPHSVAHASEKLILKHRPGWRHANSTGLNGQVLRDLQISGFTGIESFSFDVEIAFSASGWHGFLRTTSPVGPSMDAKTLAAFDREHLAMLSDWPAELVVPHRVFAVVAQKPGLDL